MKARVDPQVCAGHGLCFMNAPEVFEDDEDGYGHAKGDGTVAPGLEGKARLGADNCPERAITVE
jgi:ferredoxin